MAALVCGVLVSLCGALLPLSGHAAPREVPQFIVVDYHTISKTRVPGSPDHKPLYDYVYRVDVRNSGARAVQVGGNVTSKRKSVVVIDDAASFGTIDRHEIKTSEDTITVRAGKFFDRRLDRKVQVNGRWRFEEAGTDPEDANIHGLLRASSLWLPELLDLIYNLKFALIFDWRIQSRPDASAPIISNTLPNGLLRDRQPLVSASYQDPGGSIATSQVELTLDSVNVTAQSTVGADSVAYRSSTPMAEGEHTVALRVADNAGNVSNASWSFTIDSQPPAITGPAPYETTSASPRAAISASFADTVSGVDVSSVRLVVDGQDVTQMATANAVGILYQPTAALSEGQHTVELTLADTAGNPATLQWTFGVDASGPGIQSLLPANGAELGADAVPTISAAFNDAGSGVDTSAVTMSVDGVDVTAQAQVTAAGVTYTPAGALSEGNHQIVVVARDTNGNESMAMWSFHTRTAPQISNVQPSDVILNANDTVAISAQYQDVGSGIDTASVRLTIDGVDFTPDAQVGASSITLAPVEPLPQGLHVVDLSVSDRAGNVAVAQWRFTIDTGLPQVIQQQPRNTLVATATPTIFATYQDTGASATGIDHAQTRLFVNGEDVTAQAQVDSSVTPHRITYVPATALPEASQTIRLAIADQAGNQIEAVWAFTIDIQGPALTDLAPADGAVFAADETITLSGMFVDGGSGIDTASLRVVLDGVDVTAQAQITETGFTRAYTQPLTEGLHTLRVSVRDLAGNETVRENSFITATAPVVTAKAPYAEFLPGGAQPTITATIVDVGSGIDNASLRVYFDGVDVTAGVQVSGGSLSYAVAQPLTEGLHTVRITVADLVGNNLDHEWQFGAVTAPAITAKAPLDVVLPPGSRPAITASFTAPDSSVTSEGIRLLVNDIDVSSQVTLGSGQISYTPNAPLAAGTYTVELEILTASEAAMSATWTFAVEEEPRYELTMIDPSETIEVANPKLTVVASAVSNRTYPVLVTLNGVEMPAGGVLEDGRATYRANIDLDEGVNTLTLQATFDDGTTRTLTRQVTLLAPLRVAITSPLDKSVLGRGNQTSPGDLTGSVERPVTITGTVSKPAVSVLINQQGAQLLAGGTEFRFDNFFLHEGVNMITAVATDANGSVGSAAITVGVDQTAPILTVEAPLDAAVTSNSSIDVRGMVNDAVEGFLGAPEPTVTVNGRAAQVFDRYYLAADVPLEIGLNDIQIVATDQFGNARTSSIRVSRISVGSDRLTILSGNHQTGRASQAAPEPLTVVALDAAGRPLANRPVYFDVARGTGAISATATPAEGALPARNLQLTTDATGQARVWLTFGKQSGPAGNVVRVSHPEFVEEVLFVATTQRGPVAKVLADTGINQFAETGSQPLELLSVVVRDRDDNLLPNVPVVFKVMEGDAFFTNPAGEHVRSIVMNTDKNGLTALRPTLGATPGLVRIAALALREQDGDINDPADLTGGASYHIQVKESRDGPASFKGYIYTDKGEPLPGVRVSIGRTALSSTTDATGAFELGDVPPGRVDLFIDGRTSDHLQKIWPSLHFESYVVRGQMNQLPHPIYLPPLMMSEAKVVGGDEDVILKIPGIEGFQMKVKANSVTFPDGSRTGTLVVSPVTADRLPMAPPAGGALFGVPAWTVQPAGTRFDPPIEVQMPNATGQPAGDNLPIVQWDHDLSQYVPMGRATVSEDGAYLITDAGSGLTKAGWGGACVYDPSKCGRSGPPECGFCQEVDSSGECPTCRDLEPCEVDEPVQTQSAEFPSWAPWKSRFEDLMEAVPVISRMELNIKAKGTRKTGKECCTNSVFDRCREPQSFEQVAATGEFTAAVGFGPSLLNRDIERTLGWGNDRWRATLQTEVTAIMVAVKGNVQAQTKSSGCQTGDCSSYSGTGTLEFTLAQVGLKGELVLEERIGRPSWDRWRTLIGAGAEGQAKLKAGGISGTVEYEFGEGCQNPRLNVRGRHEEIALEGKVKLWAQLPQIIMPTGGIEWSFKEVLVPAGDL